MARCTAISDAFKAHGFDAELIVRGEGLTDWTEDGDFFADKLKDADIVVIDSYGADIGLYEKAAKTSKICIWIDDFDRLSYPAGIVHNASKTPLLRREFWHAPAKKIAHEIKSVFINLGSAAPDFDFEAAAKKAFGGNINIVTIKNASAADVKKSMAAADVAVSAAGQTLLELASMGVPTVAVITADNQLQNAGLLSRAGFCSVLRATDLDRLESVLAALSDVGKRTVMSVSGQNFFDKVGVLELAADALAAMGLGIAKYSGCMGEILEIEGIRLKPFWRMDKKESDDVLGWRNSEEIRCRMFCKEPIKREEHQGFIESLRSSRTKAYWMAEDLGVVSLSGIDYEIGRAQIGIYKAPAAQKGSGARLLSALIEIAFSKLGLKAIEAEVYMDNKAALGLYKRFGFCFNGEYESADGKVGIFELKKEEAVG